MEDRPIARADRIGPFIDGSLGPGRHRDGANMVSFAYQVGDDPMILADLEILPLEPDKLGAPKATSDQQG